jgi:inosine-uridine nucleoside N-ribohydrolase
LLRSPWFWITILLIAAGVALTTALGVFIWLIAVLGAVALLNVGVFLYAAYAVGHTEPPTLPHLERVPDESRIPLIYDCDLTMGRPFRSAGDGLALLYLLGEPRIDLRGVTTTYGNGPVGMTTRTARRLLDDVNHHHVTVAQGASGPEDDPSGNEAARYLIETVNAYPNEFVVLATGAMTNLKHASALDPDFFTKVRSLYLVGGVTGELTWNERQLAERNFSRDPEAAYTVIQSVCPTTITPGQAGLTAVFRSPQFAALQSLEGSAPRLVARRIRFWFGLMRLWFQDDGFPMWESVAAMAITHPELIDFKRAHLPITIEDLQVGRLVLDPSRAGPVRLVESVRDFDSLVKTQFAAWQRLNHSMEHPETTSKNPDNLPSDTGSAPEGGPDDAEERGSL